MDNRFARVYKSQQFIMSHILGLLDNLNVPDVVEKLMNSNNNLVLRAHWTQVLSFSSFLPPIRDQLQYFYQELAHLAILAKGYTQQTYGQSPSVKDTLCLCNARIASAEIIPIELYKQLQLAYATDWSRYKNNSSPVGFKYNLNWFEEECMALRILMEFGPVDSLSTTGDDAEPNLAYDVQLQHERYLIISSFLFASIKNLFTQFS